MGDVWVGEGSEHMSPRSDHSPLASSKADPLMPFPGYVNPTTGRCGGSCFQHQRCVGSSIKGDREFAVPIRASLSKPGARRIKAQSHLPANPRQECFLSGIVFFSSLQARSAAPTPTLCTGPAPSCWQVWTPQLPPDCPSTPLQRGRPISP